MRIADLFNRRARAEAEAKAADLRRIDLQHDVDVATRQLTSAVMRYSNEIRHTNKSLRKAGAA